MSVRLSVRREQFGYHWTDFHEIWYLKTFRKSAKKIQVSLQTDKNKGQFTWRTTHIFVIISRSFFLRMSNVSDKPCRENQNTHFVYSNFFFFRKLCRLWDNVEKCCTARQAIDDNMTQAHCMLDTQGYKSTHMLCNTHCFSTLTKAARTRLNITLYAPCLSCFNPLNTELNPICHLLAVLL